MVYSFAQRSSAYHDAMIKAGPDDISFLVFDRFMHHDIIIPKICCVAQPVELIGLNAAAFLINRLANPEIPIQRVTMKAEFIAGESCRFILPETRN